MAYLGSTVIYTSYFFHERVISDEPKGGSEIILQATIFILSSYFMAMELVQLKEEGRNYFFSVWNYTDIIPPIIHICVITLQMFGYLVNFEQNGTPHENLEWYSSIMSFASLCLWCKFFYFLRIFSDTGFLVRAII